MEIHLIEPTRNPPLRVLEKAVHREVSWREVTGLWMLLRAVDAGAYQEMLPLLWGLGAGRACLLQELAQRSALEPERERFFLLQCVSSVLC